MNTYSPYIALATGLIELLAFTYFYLLFKQSESKIKSLIAILFFLGTYQMLEAFNCMYPGHSLLVRLSFADISMLPALGVYFAYLNAPKESKMQRYITFTFLGAALFFVSYFLSKPASASLLHCQDFFATYQHEEIPYLFYGFYYQFGLFVMLLMAIRNLIFTDNLAQRQLIGDFLSGAVLFIIPSILITSFVNVYTGSMPSVMCHIAIIFGFFIIKSLARERKLRSVSLGLEIEALNIRL
jgi:hypothetical protein